MLSRTSLKYEEYNRAVSSFAEGPSPMERTKALILPSSPMLTDEFLPCRSTTELSLTPQVEAISLAYALLNSICSSADNADNAELTISMVTRALASRKHPELMQGVQSPCLLAPTEKVHLPSGHTLQAVASKLPLHVPAGQSVQAEAPGTVL